MHWRASIARKRIIASRFAELMEGGELHSRVIRDVAEIDTVLDVIIASHFTTPERAPPFTDLILSKLATYSKATSGRQRGGRDGGRRHLLGRDRWRRKGDRGDRGAGLGAPGRPRRICACAPDARPRPATTD